MLLPFYSIGSSYDRIESILSGEFLYSFDPVFRASAGMDLPVIYPLENIRIDRGNWGITLGKNGTRKNLWTRSEGIIKNAHSRLLIRNQRCLIPVNGFFVRHKSNIYFIYFPKDKIVTLAAIWKFIDTGNENEKIIEFSIITVPEEDRLGTLLTRIPQVISPNNRKKYLDIKRPLMDITRIFKKRSKSEINGYKLDPEIIFKKHVAANDFQTKEKKLIHKKPFPQKEILGGYHYH